MKKKIIIGSLVAVLTVSLISVSLLKNSSSAPVFGGGKPFLVNTREIEKGDISSYITASGTVEEIEKAEVYIDSPLKVKAVLVEKNQKVVKGQKLVELDIDSMKFELEKLKINKSTQELSLKSTSLDAQISTAESGVKSAQRNYDESRKTYNTNKALFSEGAITKSDFDASERAMAEAESALKDAKTAYNSAVSGKSEDAQVKKLNLNATQLSIQELEQKILKLNSEMYSPIDGVVANINVEEGSMADTMQPIFKVINPDRLQVRVEIKEFDIKNVAKNQNVKITGDAIEKSEEITGTVVSVSPSAQSNQTANGEEVVIEAIISIDKTIPALKPGISVDCDIYTAEKKGALIASLEMIKEDKDGNKSVFIVDSENNTMLEKPVELGITSDMSVEVVKGLAGGDIVVLDPQPVYKDGAKAKILNNGKE
jgi:multidrug efflux pump subunit AcrA (membrane-fusion protein)